MFWIGAAIARAEPVEARGGGLVIEPLAFRIGGRSRLGPRTNLDVLVGPVIAWTHPLPPFPGPAESRAIGGSLVVDHRLALLDLDPSELGWSSLVEIAYLRADHGLFPPYGGPEDDHLLSVAIGTGPGCELALGPRWSVGVDFQGYLRSGSGSPAFGTDARLLVTRYRRPT